MQGSCHGWDSLHHIGRAACYCKLRNQRSHRIRQPVGLEGQAMGGFLEHGWNLFWNSTITQLHRNYRKTIVKQSKTKVKKAFCRFIKKACFHEILPILNPRDSNQGSTRGFWTSGSNASCCSGATSGSISGNTNLGGATVVICVGICCGFAAWNSSLEFLMLKWTQAHEFSFPTTHLWLISEIQSNCLKTKVMCVVVLVSSSQNMFAQQCWSADALHQHPSHPISSAKAHAHSLEIRTTCSHSERSKQRLSTGPTCQSSVLLMAEILHHLGNKNHCT